MRCVGLRSSGRWVLPSASRCDRLRLLLSNFHPSVASCGGRVFYRAAVLFHPAAFFFCPSTNRRRSSMSKRIDRPIFTCASRPSATSSWMVRFPSAMNCAASSVVRSRCVTRSWFAIIGWCAGCGAPIQVSTFSSVTTHPRHEYFPWKNLGGSNHKQFIHPLS
jgi:hypothetical protein